ncbi:TetR/AcrR family transcriptional regulator [Sphingobium baderi]|nr:TetR/AcrR family transcriptional regulator [Sphingobium baderi]
MLPAVRASMCMTDPDLTGKARVARDSSRTIGQILAAARQEFITNGFDGTKMEHIARRAQVSKQLVYSYFNGKEELYAELSKEISREAYRRLLVIDFDAMEPQVAIRAYIEGVYDHFLDDPAIGLLTVDQSLHGGAHIRLPGGETRRMQLDLYQRIDRVLKRGQADGIFSDFIGSDMLEFMTTIIVSGCVSSRGMFERFVGRSAETDANYWRAHSVEFILRALRA